MFCKQIFTKFILISVLLSFFLIAGCTSEGTSCQDIITEIDNLENSANGRLKTMDTSSPDQFVYAQAEASKTQYADALYLLTSDGVKVCMTDVKYKNRVRYLELKYAYLDLFIRFGETEKAASAMIYQDYPEFQKELKNTISSFEDYRYELKTMQIMANDIDTSQLDPGNQDTMPILSSDIATTLTKADKYLSVLISYQ